MTDFTWMAIFGVTGLAAGFILQRSRLCFVSALRDLFLFQATGMTRSILLLLLVTTIGGTLAVSIRTAWSQPIPVLVGPADPMATLLGGFLFGFGMVLTGSCAATALWRTGEGQLSQLPILLGLFLGTNIYTSFPLFSNLAPMAVGNRWVPAGAFTIALIAMVWWQRRLQPLGEEIVSAAHRNRWRRPWPSDLGALTLAALLLIFITASGRTWGVTVALVLEDRLAIAFVLGITLGGYLSAHWGQEWRLRPMGTWPERRLRLAGGLLMGYGARMSAGCTVGLLLNGSVLGTANLLGWFLAMAAGSWLGSVALRRFIYRYLSH